MKKNELLADSEERQNVLIEGEDYYLENELMVLTRMFLLKRGFCCGNGCRHCPYPSETEAKADRSRFRSG